MIAEIASISLNRKQQKVLESVFTTPVPSTIKFSDIEKMLRSLGANVIEGDGSRVAFEYGGLKLFLHRPHPGNEAHQYQVKAVRKFIEEVGFSDE